MIVEGESSSPRPFPMTEGGKDLRFDLQPNLVVHRNDEEVLNAVAIGPCGVGYREPSTPRSAQCQSLDPKRVVDGC